MREQRPQATHRIRVVPGDSSLYRARKDQDAREPHPARGTYGLLVTADPEVRREAFARFVRRALDHARTNRGLSIPKVAELADVGVNTLYQWRNGNWNEYPKGENVEKFCDALNIPAATAYAILWPGKGTRPVEPEPFEADPEFELLLRKLRDPNVPEAEKYLIRETIRSLAARPTRPPGENSRRNAV